jgi:hypothetical protein
VVLDNILAPRLLVPLVPQAVVVVQELVLPLVVVEEDTALHRLLLQVQVALVLLVAEHIYAVVHLAVAEVGVMELLLLH